MPAKKQVRASVRAPRRGGVSVARPRQPVRRVQARPRSSRPRVARPQRSLASVQPNVRIGALGNQSCTITRREFAGDINCPNPAVPGENAAFNIRKFLAINPGSVISFPWLAPIARSFESYVFTSLKFIYVPTCSNLLNGTIGMSVDYDPTDSAPIGYTEMLNSKSAVQGKVGFPLTLSCTPQDLHKRKQWYVFTEDTDVDDLREVFVCNFQVAMSQVTAYDGTALGTTVEAGKLWIEYTVQLMTPQMQDVVGTMSYEVDTPTISTNYPNGSAVDTLVTGGQVRNDRGEFWSTQAPNRPATVSPKHQISEALLVCNEVALHANGGTPWGSGDGQVVQSGLTITPAGSINQNYGSRTVGVSHKDSQNKSYLSLSLLSPQDAENFTERTSVMSNVANFWGTAVTAVSSTLSSVTQLLPIAEEAFEILYPILGFLFLSNERQFINATAGMSAAAPLGSSRDVFSKHITASSSTTLTLRPGSYHVEWRTVGTVITAQTVSILSGGGSVMHYQGVIGLGSTDCFTISNLYGGVKGTPTVAEVPLVIQFNLTAATLTASIVNIFHGNNHSGHAY